MRSLFLIALLCLLFGQWGRQQLQIDICIAEGFAGHTQGDKIDKSAFTATRISQQRQTRLFVEKIQR